MRRRMMPTTLATTSRKESKLNSISRTLRRRRIMVSSRYSAGDDADDIVVGIQVAAHFRHRQRLKGRIDGQKSADVFGPHQQTHLRMIGRLTRPARGLAAVDHLLDCFYQWIVGG